MKKSLGKILFILLIYNLSIYANELATYTLHANKTDLYVKEAVKISFVAKQQDHTNVMFFFLKPKLSEDYEIKLLNKKTTELAYHDFTTTFTYILFPLKAKELHIDFEFTIKEASDEAVAQVYTGSRDNVKWIDTDDTKITIKPLLIKVKKLQRSVDLIGDFTLNAKINKTDINPYESVNLLYTLQGEGYKNKKLQLLNNINNVTIFGEIHDAYSKLYEDGYRIKKDFIYALNAKKSFTIPAVAIEAYSPKKRDYYTLTTPAYNINVKKIDISTLLDNEEYPITKPFISFESIKHFFIYILIFITGYITALYKPHLLKKRTIPTADKKIVKSKTAKDLLHVLTNYYDIKELKNEITLLEEAVYKNRHRINLQKLKSNIIKKLNTKKKEK